MIEPGTKTVVVTVQQQPDGETREVVFIWRHVNEEDRFRASWLAIGEAHSTRVVPSNTDGEHSVYLIDPSRAEHNLGIVKSASGQNHKDAWTCAATWAIGGKLSAWQTLVSIESSNELVERS